MKRACLSACFLVLVGCAEEPTPEVTMHEPAAELTPDPNYRLTASQRERLASAFDPDATEALLALYSDAGAREELLTHFLSLADGVTQGTVTIDGLRYLGQHEQEHRAVQSLVEKSPFSRTQRPETTSDQTE